MISRNLRVSLAFGLFISSAFVPRLASADTPATKIISASPTGFPGSDSTLDAKITADGRYVVFSSNADNLVPNDTNKKNRCLSSMIGQKIKPRAFRWDTTRRGTKSRRTTPVSALPSRPMDGFIGLCDTSDQYPAKR